MLKSRIFADGVVPCGVDGGSSVTPPSGGSISQNSKRRPQTQGAASTRVSSPQTAARRSRVACSKKQGGYLPLAGIGRNWQLVQAAGESRPEGDLGFAFNRFNSIASIQLCIIHDVTDPSPSSPFLFLNQTCLVLP